MSNSSSTTQGPKALVKVIISGNCDHNYCWSNICGYQFKP